jgi:hypothetical protein
VSSTHGRPANGPRGAGEDRPSDEAATADARPPDAAATADDRPPDAAATADARPPDAAAAADAPPDVADLDAELLRLAYRRALAATERVVQRSLTDFLR